MTATVDETKTEATGGGVGRIARVIGPVVDIEFPADAMPDDLQRARPASSTLGGRDHGR